VWSDKLQQLKGNKVSIHIYYYKFIYIVPHYLKFMASEGERWFKLRLNKCSRRKSFRVAIVTKWNSRKELRVLEANFPFKCSLLSSSSIWFLFYFLYKTTIHYPKYNYNVQCFLWSSRTLSMFKYVRKSN